MHELREPALAALRWIDEYGDRDGDGFVEYERRTPRGLENQSWKDSGDSQRFHDGTLREAPIAPCEVQGYVYDAKRRMAELAREVWRDNELSPSGSTARRKSSARRFDDAYWVEDRGGYYALALDGEKNRVDSLCSNIGHLLWSGIVPPGAGRRGRRRADGRGALVGLGRADDVAGDAAYSPLSYHNGNGLAARQLPDRLGARASRALAGGAPDRALDVRRRRLTSATSCPRCSRGCPRGRRRSRSPIRPRRGRRPGPPARRCCCSSCCSACSPTGGARCSRRSRRSSCRRGRGDVRLSGVRAFDRQWDVRLEDGDVTIVEA